VTPNETEFEIEFARDSDEGGAESYHVHIQCFKLWEHELREVRSADGRPAADRLRRAADRLRDGRMDARRPLGGFLLSGSVEGKIFADERNGGGKPGRPE
jgi:hypothetical protein